MNPLDVIKVRMQAIVNGSKAVPTTFRSGRSGRTAAAAGGTHTQGQRLAMMGLVPAHCELGLACPRLGNERVAYVLCPPTCSMTTAAHGQGALATARALVRKEGIVSLWRGTDAALLMQVPAVAIYLPLYDATLDALRTAGTGAAAPPLSGALARTAAVLATSPFEYVRTRVYAPVAGGQRPPTAWTELRSALATRSGARTLYTGAGATLLRDVPFSFCYWGLFEPVRWRISQARRDREGVSSAAASAADLSKYCTAAMAAGGIAALITTPLDVVKTRVQLGNSAPGATAPPPRALVATAMELVNSGGVRTLFAGWVPRVMRASPACGITIASYELMLGDYIL